MCRLELTAPLLASMRTTLVIAVVVVAILVLRWCIMEALSDTTKRR